MTCRVLEIAAELHGALEVGNLLKEFGQRVVAFIAWKKAKNAWYFKDHSGPLSVSQFKSPLTTRKSKFLSSSIANSSVAAGQTLLVPESPERMKVCTYCMAICESCVHSQLVPNSPSH